jgi:hypothetical protein
MGGRWDVSQVDAAVLRELREGRTGRIVRWLAENVQRVEGPEKVQLTFDCAGRAVSVELKERQRIEESSQPR